MTYQEFCNLLDTTKENRLNDADFDALHDEILENENFQSDNIKFIESEYSICGWYNSSYYNIEKNYYFYVPTYEKRFKNPIERKEYYDNSFKLFLEMKTLKDVD